MIEFLKHPAMTKVTFEQDEDTDGRSDIESQTLDVECIHVPGEDHPDGNPGRYWVIQTNRWAFTDLDALIELLKKAGVEGKRHDV